MESAFVTAAVAAALVVVGCALLVTLSGRRRLTRELADARTRLDQLAAQVESLQGTPPAPSRAPRSSPAVTADREYLITSVGREQEPETPPVSAQRFVSVAAGESLVRLLSLGYGVRRALSAESRNRIGFQMRQQVKATRKRRRRDLRQARRTMRAAGAEDAA